MFVYTIEHVIGAIVILGLLGVVAYFKLSLKYWAWKGRRVAQAALKERAEAEAKEAAELRAEDPTLTEAQIRLRIEANRQRRIIDNARIKGKPIDRDTKINATMDNGRIIVNPQAEGGVKIQNSCLSGAHVQNNLAQTATFPHLTTVYDERLFEAALMERPEPHVSEVEDCGTAGISQEREYKRAPSYQPNKEEGRKTDDSEPINHRTDFRPCAPVNRSDSDEASSGRWLGESGGAAKGWNDSPSSSNDSPSSDSSSSSQSYD